MYRTCAATHCHTDPEIAAICILPHPPYLQPYSHFLYIDDGIYSH